MDLTMEDKLAIKEMMAGAGWVALDKAMAEKIEECRNVCENCRDDHRHFQGMLFGMRQMKHYAESIAKNLGGVHR